MALVASTAEAAQAAEMLLRKRYAFIDAAEADLIVALGGDGFMLHTLHEMLARGRVCPVFGMNRGTVGFLMNEWRIDRLAERLQAAKAIRVFPLEMTARTVSGETFIYPAINEVSRQQSVSLARQIPWRSSSSSWRPRNSGCGRPTVTSSKQRTNAATLKNSPHSSAPSP